MACIDRHLLVEEGIHIASLETDFQVTRRLLKIFSFPTTISSYSNRFATGVVLNGLMMLKLLSSKAGLQLLFCSLIWLPVLLVWSAKSSNNSLQIHNHVRNVYYVSVFDRLGSWRAATASWWEPELQQSPLMTGHPVSYITKFWKLSAAPVWKSSTELSEVQLSCSFQPKAFAKEPCRRSSMICHLLQKGVWIPPTNWQWGLILLSRWVR